MAGKDDDSISFMNVLRQMASRFYWRRLQLMKTDSNFRYNNQKMIGGSIFCFVFCIFGIFIVGDPVSSLNLLFVIGAIVFGLAGFLGVKLWVDSRNSN